MIGSDKTRRPGWPRLGRLGGKWAGRSTSRRWSFYANSLWLIAAQAANYCLGFLFWLAVARGYTATDVGNGSALLSAAMMIAFVGTMGLGYGLIRFVRSSDHAPLALVNGTLTAVTGMSLLFGILFLAGLDAWSPALRFARVDPAYLLGFLLLVALTALYQILGQAFVATRHAGYASLLSVVLGVSKLVLVVVLARLVGGSGIVLAWTVATGAAVLLGLFWLLPREFPGFHPRVALYRHPRGEVAAFAGANYLTEGLWSLPGWLLPLLVLQFRGPAETAVLVVVWGVAMLPFSVPQALSLSMFAEGAHDETDTVGNLTRGVWLSAALVVPAIGLLVIFGSSLLRLYGEQYASAGGLLLTISSVAVLPATLTILYVGVARVQKRLSDIVLASATVALVTLGGSALLVPRLGIRGVGVALLVGHSVAAVGSLWRLRTIARAGRAPHAGRYAAMPAQELGVIHARLADHSDFE